MSRINQIGMTNAHGLGAILDGVGDSDIRRFNPL